MLKLARKLSKTIKGLRARLAIHGREPKSPKQVLPPPDSMETRMKITLIAATFAVGFSLAIGGIASAQSPGSGTQLRMAQADEDVSVKKKETPYGTKKVVKKKIGEGYGIRCKKVSVTRSTDTGDTEKKTAARCG
jgi:hypothetical protein